MKTKGTLVRVVVCLFVCLLGLGTASADTLFSNLGQSVDGAGFLPNTSRRLATDFQTGPGATTVTGGSLKLNNPDGIPHTYTASLWTDNAGLPGTMFGAFNPILVPSGNSGDFATTPTGSINLAASTPFWEVLQVNENELFVVDPEWKFTSTQATDAGSIFTTIPSTFPQVSLNSGASWQNLATGNFQFSLTGVPEPTGGSLLLVGGPLLLGIRRNRKPC